MSTSVDVAVLGAGPAGLAAALAAARRGVSVTVLERADVVGGMAASFEVAGVRVDHGSHRLHPTTDPAVLAELRALLGDDLQWRLRNGRIRLAGRWVRFPLSAADLARNLPPSFALAAARDAALSPLRRPRADTFAEVVRAGLGPAMGERFYFPYARKLWGLGPEQLSGEQARRRIGASTPSAMVRKVVRRGGPPGFWYPKRGFGQIVDALADAAVAAGVDIRLGSAVTECAVPGGGERPRGTAHSIRVADGTEVEARHVWSTIPLAAFARLLDGTPAAVEEAAGRLTSRALALVYLAADRPRWTAFDAHYFPLLDTPVSRVSEPRNYRDAPGDDPPGATVLCAEVPCSVGDDVWSADDDVLGARVADDLARQGLPPVDPVEVVVRRLPAAYPVCRVGFEADLATVDGWVSSRPGVVTLGRHGLFAHDNTHHAMAEGWEAASCLRPDGAWDGDRWRRAQAAFAAHVVED